MKREDFMKKRWKPFEIIEYQSSHRDRGELPPVDCLLLAVDFENETMKLEPLDQEKYERESFWSSIDWCKRPRPKPKLLKT